MKTTTTTTFTVPGNISATFLPWTQPKKSDAGHAYPPRELARELRKAKAGV